MEGVRRRLARLLNARRRRTSLSDNIDYPAFCALANRDEGLFAEFKRHPTYNAILEHVTEEQGAAYLEIIIAEHPKLLPYFDRFRENDKWGNPIMFDYQPHGRLSPTTLRYIKVLGDLIANFGSLADMDLVEIGGGYGGQCKTIDAFCGFRSYTLVDLGPCLSLAEKYLDKHQVKNVQYRTFEDLFPTGHYDLVISNYAFSECSRRVQETLWEKALSVSARGYLTCNEISPRRFKPFSQSELRSRLPDAKVLPEEPPTHPDNYILLWGGR